MLPLVQRNFRYISFLGTRLKRVQSKMAHNSSKDRPDHMQRTSESGRQENLNNAVVTEVTQLSPTVKGLTLKVLGDCSFKAGQWIDFHIPTVETVGGYSITSSPNSFRKKQSLDLAVKFSTHPPAHWLHLKLQRVDFFIEGVSIFTGYSMVSSPALMTNENKLELAIKYSDYPPTEWVHLKCKVGSEVKVRVGGDFFYDPQPKDPAHNLLLLAGGVGINPLLSTMRHVWDLKRQNKDVEIPHIPNKVQLIYSASTANELVFQDKIDEMCAQCEGLRTTYHVTKETPTDAKYKAKRIDSEAVKQALSSLHENNNNLPVICYICGPGPMIDDMEKCLISLGITKERIHYEKWW